RNAADSERAVRRQFHEPMPQRAQLGETLGTLGPGVAPTLVGIETEASDFRRRLNALHTLDEVVERVVTIEIRRHIAGQPHLAFHDSRTAPKIQFGLLSRIEIQRYTRPGAIAFVFPRTQMDRNANGNRRHAQKLESAIRIGDSLQPSSGMDSRPVEGIDANRI